MTPQHVTSLWPIIISEMVQVFLHIEQELSTDTEEFRYVIIDLAYRFIMLSVYIVLFSLWNLKILNVILTTHSN